MNFLNNLNMTALGALVSLFLGALYVITILVGAMLGKTLSQDMLNTAGLFIVGMFGKDATVFGLKRFSDRDYAAAKAGPATQVTVAAPAPVSSSGERGE